MSGSVVLEGQEAADRGPVLEMTPEESPKSGPTPEEALAASQKAIEQSERARVEAHQGLPTARPNRRFGLPSGGKHRGTRPPCLRMASGDGSRRLQGRGGPQ